MAVDCLIQSKNVLDCYLDIISNNSDVVFLGDIKIKPKDLFDNLYIDIISFPIDDLNNNLYKYMKLYDVVDAILGLKNNYIYLFILHNSNSIIDKDAILSTQVVVKSTDLAPIINNKHINKFNIVDFTATNCYTLFRISNNINFNSYDISNLKFWTITSGTIDPSSTSIFYLNVREDINTDSNFAYLYDYENKKFLGVFKIVSINNNTNSIGLENYYTPLISTLTISGINTKYILIPDESLNLLDKQLEKLNKILSLRLI